MPSDKTPPDDAALIVSPLGPAFDALCGELAGRSAELDLQPQWPAEQLAACARAGVYRWFVPGDWGGFGWSEADLLRGYMRLASACLTTTFILTQFTSALRRIVDSDNEPLARRLLPEMLAGRHFTTVGISHLTTSRRHLAEPALKAAETADGFLLDGYSPWVTGAGHAQSVVVGATLPDRRQLLISLPIDLAGVTTPAPRGSSAYRQAARGSCVARGSPWGGSFSWPDRPRTLWRARSAGKPAACKHRPSRWAWPPPPSISSRARPRSGPICRGRWPACATILETARDDLLGLAAGEQPCTSEGIRARANSLALCAAQSALAAAKGTGYLAGHPAGRWCREALFFLVWSCPQPVMAANLCELAGLEACDRRLAILIAIPVHLVMAFQFVIVILTRRRTSGAP